ncbi:hypothetical protein TNIN_176801 [Trichonephila inaurata madagascariensis]|uniref:Uncharacterized protein n=1 Tax=Trichonephila inaurata madagascariensis TaxID=2747483 RepID=A0A8X7CMV0_9ARAC|nr:hypothetical protein TNIN_176801 [Trichonephila inaurata madagascariensis]
MSLSNSRTDPNKFETTVKQDYGQKKTYKGWPTPHGLPPKFCSPIFWDILKWNDEAKKYAPYTKFFVIGCKMDNRLDNGTVSMEEGLSMGMLIQAVKYYECSSVTGIRVALPI